MCGAFQRMPPDAVTLPDPENWLVQHALARLYRAVASTNPEYAARARRYYERSLELAPARDPYMPLDTPHWRHGRSR